MAWHYPFFQQSALYESFNYQRSSYKKCSISLSVVTQPWQLLLPWPFQLLLMRKSDCWSGCFRTSWVVVSFFWLRYCMGFGSLLCFVLIRCLVFKQLLIQCCNSVTEDHSIVFLVLYVAVFNKPLDYPGYFKYREWCFSPWMS